MIEIVNSVQECLDKTHQVRQCGSDLDGDAIHRFHVPGMDTAAKMAEFDRGRDNLGNKMAYNVVFHPSGVVEQALPLDVFGWHAKGWSRRWAGLVVWCDCRVQPPTDPQYASLVEYLALSAQRRGRINIKAHDQLPGSSDDPDKACPGKYLPIGDLHYDVSRWLKRNGEALLVAKGLILNKEK